MAFIATSILAVGTASVVQVWRAERKKRKSRARALRRPTLRAAEVLARLDAEGAQTWPMLAVHVRSVRLPPRFAGQGLRVRVKCGEAGVSTRCDTQPAWAALPARPAAARFVSRLPERQEPAQAFADFGSTCIFEGNRHGETVVRIRLLDASGHSRLAETSLRVSCSLRQFAHMDDMELNLYGTGLRATEVVGHLTIAADLVAVPREGLKGYLELMEAQRRGGALRTAPQALVQGWVPEGGLEPEAARCITGQPLARAARAGTGSPSTASE
mmetsp:Transcript_117861/g.380377  ORF Transcript_117861/g.380377 Transcript_117861/m.380377 type:complete len:271 (-) Transcript_117861:182-994(-)